MFASYVSMRRNIVLEHSTIIQTKKTFHNYITWHFKTGTKDKFMLIRRVGGVLREMKK